MATFVWIAFLLFILTIVLLDLGVFHRKAHVISLPEALIWTATWIALALAFNLLVYFLYAENWLAWSDLPSHHLTGRQAAIQFFTGYLLEKSLSLDNMFFIATIFAYFGVPSALQHRLLFWGILGAVLLRAVMIMAGPVLIQQYDWIVYLFGVLLIASATKMLVIRHDNINPDKNLGVRLTRRFYPVTTEFDGSRFFTRTNGQRSATPLVLALILVGTVDVMFAIDSIPAIFAFTRDSFLVYTSNVFAILGLRSLYFSLAGLIHRFRYLKMSLVFLLAYVGIKMLLWHQYSLPNLVSLAIISVILSIGLLASLIGSYRDTAALASLLRHDLEQVISITYRQTRRVVILIVGSTVLLIGMAMVVLPGPAIIVIPLGVGILAIEFAWARRWLQRIRKTVENAQQYSSNRARKRNTSRNSKKRKAVNMENSGDAAGKG